jgi:hypothetical protein
MQPGTDVRTVFDVTNSWLSIAAALLLLHCRASLAVRHVSCFSIVRSVGTVERGNHASVKSKTRKALNGLISVIVAN